MTNDDVRPRTEVPVPWIGMLIMHTGTPVVHRDTGRQMRPTEYGSALDQGARTELGIGSSKHLSECALRLQTSRESGQK